MAKNPLFFRWLTKEATRNTVLNLNTKQIYNGARLNLPVLSLLLLVSATACSHLPDWMGEAKHNSGIKGTRISILNIDSTVAADAALSELKVTLPETGANDRWHKSSGMPYMVPSNPKLSHPLTVKLEVGAGSGPSGNEHMAATPIVAEGKIFTISANGKVSAFNAFNIKKNLWRTQLEITTKKEAVSSAAGMTYHNGKLYIATGYNEVDALDANTGKLVWRRVVNSIVRAAPEVRNNAIFVNTVENRLYALDVSDGGILWTHTGGNEEISIFGTGSPLAVDNIVVVPYSSGDVYGLRTSDGNEVWQNNYARRAMGPVRTLSDIDASPVFSNGKAFVISSDGVLASTDIKSGKRLWEQPVSGRQSPWVAGDFLYLLSNKNELICMHANSGGVKWIKQLKAFKKNDSKKGPIKWSGPVLAGDLLWVVGSHGKIMALSPNDGEMLYERSVPKDIYLPPVVAYESIYLFNDSAKLIQLSAKK